MTDQTQNDEESNKELQEISETVEALEEKDLEKLKHSAPQIPGHTSKTPSFPNGNHFGKWSNFFNNSFNKQRQWRAAWRWR